jgi:predicted transcriptional regulator
MTLCFREILTIDSNLRQENTELKHRLRQLESRVGSSSSEGGMTNQKLRKQVETLKRELASLSEAYEKLKIDSTREISKWRSQIIQPAGHDDYKMKFISLQHIVESERIDHRREINKLLREIKEIKNSRRVSSRSPSPAQTRTGRIRFECPAPLINST